MASKSLKMKIKMKYPGYNHDIAFTLILSLILKLVTLILGFLVGKSDSGTCNLIRFWKTRNHALSVNIAKYIVFLQFHVYQMFIDI